MNAVIAYFRAFFDGELDSFSTHAALIGIIAAAEIGLAIGICLESPKEKGFREWLGLILVLGGCVFSVIATVFLLIFDEGISRGQKADIKRLAQENATLRLQAAPRKIDNDKFRAVLSKSPEKAVVQIRYTKGDPEPYWFSKLLQFVLLSAGWDANDSKEADPDDLPSRFGSEPIISGLVLLTSDPEATAHPGRGAFGALLYALGTVSPTVNWGLDPRLPKGTLKVIISPKAIPMYGPNDTPPFK